MSRRVEKIKAQLGVLAAEYLLREKNSNITVLVSDIDVSADMKRATVWYGIEFGEITQDEIETLRKGLQQYFASHLKMRSTPKVELRFDIGQVHANKIDELLKQ